MRFLMYVLLPASILMSACGDEHEPDSEPPMVVLTSPAPGVVRGAVSLVADVDDNVGVASVQFQVDGAAIGQPLTAPPFQTTWDAGQVANGTYTLTATATDLAGNDAQSPEIEVTVQNTSTLRVTTTSAGFDIDPDGYRVVVDGADMGAVGPNGSNTLLDVITGPHTITLAGVTGNCAVHLPRLRTVDLVIEVQADVFFTVTCGLASGPTAERILFSRPNLTPLGNGPEQLHAVNADGTGHVQLTDDQYNYVGMAWSPDRTTILFASDRPGPSTYSLYLMNADGSNIRPVDEVIRMGSAGWSPDGTRIVYADFTGIQTVNPDGTGHARLTSDSGDSEPAWSPDGGRIAFSRGGRLYVMNADGSDAHPISDGIGGEVSPRWSPDGTRILYVGNRDLGLDIYVIQDDGANRRNVTTEQLNDSDPAWSPSGERIIYTTGEFPSPILYVVQTDGTGAPVPVLEGAARFNAWR